MCQGLTSAGGAVPDNIGENQVVAIYVEGKEHALAIGTTLMTSFAMFVLPFHHAFFSPRFSRFSIPQQVGEPRPCAGQPPLPQ